MREANNLSYTTSMTPESIPSATEPTAPVTQPTELVTVPVTVSGGTLAVTVTETVPPPPAPDMLWWAHSDLLLARLSNTLACPTQRRVSEYVEGMLCTLGRPYTKDGKGNIYSDPDPSVRKPWLVGHMDTVHRTHVDDQPLTIVESNGWLMAVWNGKDGKSAPRQTGIGGDDKCGVWAALEAAQWEKYAGGKPVGLFFPVDEEIGCVGSNYAVSKHKDRFASATCFLQLDRREYGDAIQRTNGCDVWSPEFRALLETLMPSHGMQPNYGSSTDIGVLGPACGVPAINIGSGYHNPHSDVETVNIREATRALNFALHLVEVASDTENLGTISPAPVYTGFSQPSRYPGYQPGFGGTMYYGDGTDPDLADKAERQATQPFALDALGWPTKKSGKGKKDKQKVRAPLTVPGIRRPSRSLDAMCHDLEEFVRDALSYPDGWVKVETSPRGVAVYFTEDSTYEWPSTGEFDVTGFAKNHADRLAMGQVMLEHDKRAFRVTIRGKTGTDWVLTRAEGKLMSVNAGSLPMYEYVDELLEAFGDNLVEPVFEPLQETKTTEKGNLLYATKVTNAPVWRGCAKDRPTYIPPTTFFALKNPGAARLTEETVIFVELTSPRHTLFTHQSMVMPATSTEADYALAIQSLIPLVEEYT